MRIEDFNKIIENQLNYCKSLMISKGQEYAQNDVDRLLVFKHAGAIQGESQKMALAGMMSKHTISIYKMCQKGTYPIEQWIEKITDNINYLLILRAMIEEEKENNENGNLQ